MREAREAGPRLRPHRAAPRRPPARTSTSSRRRRTRRTRRAWAARRWAAWSPGGSPTFPIHTRSAWGRRPAATGRSTSSGAGAPAAGTTCPRAAARQPGTAGTAQAWSCCRRRATSATRTTAWTAAGGRPRLRPLLGPLGPRPGAEPAAVALDRIRIRTALEPRTALPLPPLLTTIGTGAPPGPGTSRRPRPPRARWRTSAPVPAPPPRAGSPGPPATRAGARTPRTGGRRCPPRPTGDTGAGTWGPAGARHTSPASSPRYDAAPGAPPPPRSAQATARGGTRSGQDLRGVGRKNVEHAGPRLEQCPAPPRFGGTASRTGFCTPNLTQPESEGAGISEPTGLFLKPDKGFLTSPDRAGGGGCHTSPPRPGPWPPHHCAAPRPQPRPRGSLFLTFHPSGLKTVTRVRQTVTLDLGPAIQKSLTPDCDF